MLENFRNFKVDDPFGRTWNVEFRWLQNAISIRHSDTVDVKYYLSAVEEPARELVIALPHANLVDLASRRKREVTDAWCMQLAGLHVVQVISGWDDMEKTIVTMGKTDLENHNLELEAAARAETERAALYR